VRTREEQIVREYSEQEKQLREVVELVKDKLSQSESKVVTLTAGRYSNKGGLRCLIIQPIIALESTQAELFDLKNKFDEESTAKLVLLLFTLEYCSLGLRRLTCWPLTWKELTK